MSDAAPTPGTGQDFPTYGSDASPNPGTMTPHQARHAIRHFEDTAAWRMAALDPDALGRLALIERRSALYAAAYPEDTRPRDAVTGMVNAPPPEAPPASAPELHTALSNHVAFPSHIPMADRGEFLSVSREGLAALGASRADAGWFSHAAGEVLRAPDSFTPEAAEKTLRATWGGAYEANLRAAQHAVRSLPTPVRAHLTETPIGNHPRVLQILADAGRRMAARGAR